MNLENNQIIGTSGVRQYAPDDSGETEKENCALCGEEHESFVPSCNVKTRKRELICNECNEDWTDDLFYMNCDLQDECPRCGGVCQTEGNWDLEIKVCKDCGAWHE